MKNRILSLTVRTALVANALIMSSGAFAEAKSGEPFTGEWVSKQYTNGKEFHLKIQQDKNELVGWEGRLPPQQLPEPDFTGIIDGKEAEIEVVHRRGYKAHVKLSIRGDRLVWQLIDATGRSSRYFPLASTLIKQADSIASDKTQTLKYTSPPAGTNSSIQPVSTSANDADTTAAPATPSPSQAIEAGRMPALPGSNPASSDSAATRKDASENSSTSSDNKASSEASSSNNNASSGASASQDSAEPKPAPDFRQPQKN
jgi:hypothetical protein